MSKERRINREDKPIFTFDAASEIVAEQIKNAHLIVGEHDLTITGVRTFTREQNKAKSGQHYRLILESPVGKFLSVPYMGQYVLPIITTHEKSCVLIDGGKIGNQEIKGPGKISKVLGLQKNGVYAMQVVGEPGQLTISVVVE